MKQRGTDADDFPHPASSYVQAPEVSIAAVTSAISEADTLAIVDISAVCMKILCFSF